MFGSGSNSGSWDVAPDHCGLVVEVFWKLTSGDFFIKKNAVSHGGGSGRF